MWISSELTNTGILFLEAVFEILDCKVLPGLYQKLKGYHLFARDPVQ